MISDYIDQKEEELRLYNEQNHINNNIRINARRETNLGVFRMYLIYYLKSLSVVSHGMTLIVRQLQPTANGIPLELYFFSAIKEWVAYEGIQADVFDHVLAVIPEFDLRVFQNVSGNDLLLFSSIKPDNLLQ